MGCLPPPPSLPSSLSSVTPPFPSSSPCPFSLSLCPPLPLRPASPLCLFFLPCLQGLTVYPRLASNSQILPPLPCTSWMPRQGHFHYIKNWYALKIQGGRGRTSITHQATRFSNLAQELFLCALEFHRASLSVPGFTFWLQNTKLMPYVLSTLMFETRPVVLTSYVSIFPVENIWNGSEL